MGQRPLAVQKIKPEASPLPGPRRALLSVICVRCSHNFIQSSSDSLPPSMNLRASGRGREAVSPSVNYPGVCANKQRLHGHSYTGNCAPLASGPARVCFRSHNIRNSSCMDSAQFAPLIEAKRKAKAVHAVGQEWGTGQPRLSTARKIR